MSNRYTFIVLLIIIMQSGYYSTGYSQWEVLHPSVLSYNTQSRAIGCAFVNKDSGFILTNKGLAYTTDRGATWQMESAPGNPLKIYFASFNNGWIEGDPAHLYRTVDHGSHWEADSNLFLSGFGPDAAYSIYFQDSLNGWQGSESLSIFQTSDAGKTWREQYNNNNFPNAWVSNIQFCNSRCGIALGNYEFEMTVFRTSDGGDHWMNVVKTPQVWLKPDGPTGLAYTDPAHAWLSTVSSGIYRSTDSGQTWNYVIIPHSSINDGIQSMSFSDSNHGIVVERNTIDTNTNIASTLVAHTSDGGKTWDTTRFEDLIWYASFPDSSIAYVCGYYNLYRLSTANLAVQPLPEVPTTAQLENEGGNLYLAMPQNTGGTIRTTDILGRVLNEQKLSPGARYGIENKFQSLPQFRFVIVEAGGKIQVFKYVQ